MLHARRTSSETEPIDAVAVFGVLTGGWAFVTPVVSARLSFRLRSRPCVSAEVQWKPADQCPSQRRNKSDKSAVHDAGERELANRSGRRGRSELHSTSNWPPATTFPTR